MLPKEQRINKKEQFELIYRNGLVFNFKNFRVFSLKNNSLGLRFTVIVSKKISPLATQRNKIKRIIREILIKNKGNIPLNLDLLIIINNSNVFKIKKEELEKDFFYLSKKLHSNYNNPQERNHP